jgi:signal peptidase II
LAILLVDFLTKAYVYHILSSWGKCATNGGCLDIPVFNILGVYFSIGFALNKGAAWGLFSNFQTFLLIIRIATILFLFIYLFFINKNRYAQFPLILILAGAIGNVADFFLYGKVVDFLHFNLWGYEFPVFNIADSAITIGVIWLLFATSFNKKKAIKA